MAVVKDSFVEENTASFFLFYFFSSLKKKGQFQTDI